MPLLTPVTSMPSNVVRAANMYTIAARDRLKPGGSCRAAKRTAGAPFCDGVIVLEGTIRHRASNLEHQTRAAWRPTHLLLGGFCRKYF